MKIITKIIIIGTICGLIGFYLWATLHGLNTGIQECRDLGYEGIKFTKKYTLDYVCSQ